MAGPTPYVTRPPHPALAPYVSSLVAYDIALGDPGVHRGLPSTELTLVLPIGEPLDVGWAGDPSSRTARWSVLSGLHTLAAEIHHGGRQAGVQVGLTAAGARALFGLPSAALARQVIGCDDVGDAGAADVHALPHRLGEVGDQTRRLLTVEHALLQALTRHDAAGPRAEVGRALTLLRRGVPVGAVAHDVGWSRRHLSAQFRAECGLTPKQYQRVARFERAHWLLRRTAGRGTARLADIAAQTGYADQAHFTREWVDLAGCTPGGWLATEFPFLQDLAGSAADGGF